VIVLAAVGAPLVGEYSFANSNVHTAVTIIDAATAWLRARSLARFGDWGRHIGPRRGLESRMSRSS
jgi:hypothetical protein